jgi:hypothetical protein
LVLYTIDSSMKLFALVALITRVFSQGISGSGISGSGSGFVPGGSLGNGGTTGVPQIAPTSNYTRYVASTRWNQTVTPVVSLELSATPTGSSSGSSSSSASASASASASVSSSVSVFATETPSPTSYQPLSLTPSITPSQTPTNAPRNTTNGEQNKNQNVPSNPSPDPTTITLGIIAACACVIGVIFVVNKTHKTMIRRRHTLFAPAVVISNPTQALGNQYGRAHASV